MLLYLMVFCLSIIYNYARCMIFTIVLFIKQFCKKMTAAEVKTKRGGEIFYGGNFNEAASRSRCTLWTPN